MKIKDLTKEQRYLIEDYEIGKELIYLLENTMYAIHIKLLKKESKRVIQRIKNDIEFLTYYWSEMKRNPDIMTYITTNLFRRRINKLKVELILYKLMEQLE